MKLNESKCVRFIINNVERARGRGGGWEGRGRRGGGTGLDLTDLPVNNK